MKCCFIEYFIYALLIIGGLNWGLVGVLQFDLVAFLFGNMTLVARIVYGLVGVAAVLGILKLFKFSCCSCK
ncbi:MAG: DUF378 domain-containing protein [Candidatus Babeliales bacterium]|jgi:hypothetical protein